MPVGTNGWGCGIHRTCKPSVSQGEGRARGWRDRRGPPMLRALVNHQRNTEGEPSTSVSPHGTSFQTQPPASSQKAQT